MSTTIKNTSFATLFKKYRLRSEISTLSEFGDLLAEEGMIYETSLFTRWQNGERVPRDRKVILAIIMIFIKNGGIQSISDANKLMEATNQRDLIEEELVGINKYIHLNKNETLPSDPLIFIERPNLIKDIAWELINKRKVWLFGMPGVGKTTIAFHLAHVLNNVFTDGIFCFRADIKDFELIIDELLRSLGYNSLGLTNLDTKCNNLLKIIQGKNILLILDNISQDTFSEKEISYFINLFGIGVIFTSVEMAIDHRLCKIKIESFTEDEFTILADRILSSLVLQSQKKKIQKLGSILGYLPISSIIVLKRVCINPLFLNDFLKQLGYNNIDFHKMTYDNKNLHNAFEFSFSKLILEDRQLLVLCSIFDGTDFSIDALAYLEDSPKVKIKTQLLRLVKFSLIERSVRDRYRLHPTIKNILKRKVNKNHYDKLTKYYLIKLSNYVIGTTRYFEYLKNELENILTLIVWCYSSRKYDQVITLWPIISIYIFYSGNWRLIYKYNRIIQNSFKYSSDLKGLGQYILEDIGRIYFFQNKRSRIAEIINMSNKLADKSGDLVLKGMIKSKQGIVFHQMNELKKAEFFFTDAIELLINTNRKDELLKSYAYLAIVYAKLNNNDKFVEYSDKVLNTQDSLRNDSVKGFINILLGQAFLYSGLEAKAEEYFLKGYNLETKYHVKIGQAFSSQGLGMLYCNQGNTLKSLKFFYRALDIYKELGMKKEESQIRRHISSIN